jgi:epoxyqueuosine reductase
MCGTCDRCIRSCPTGAIEAPRKLNATKCISYWTIEAKDSVPLELKEKIGDWFFGCDICQTVCPWNEKAFGKETLKPRTQEKAELLKDLEWILSSSGKTLAKVFKNSALSRARPRTLKRNALTIIGNLNLQEMKPLVLKARENPELSETALWALDKLENFATA